MAHEMTNTQFDGFCKWAAEKKVPLRTRTKERQPVQFGINREAARVIFHYPEGEAMPVQLKSAEQVDEALMAMAFDLTALPAGLGGVKRRPMDGFVDEYEKRNPEIEAAREARFAKATAKIAPK